jgi:hypothetical protein
MDGLGKGMRERERERRILFKYLHKSTITKARSHPHRLMDLEVPPHPKEEMHVSRVE